MFAANGRSPANPPQCPSVLTCAAVVAPYPLAGLRVLDLARVVAGPFAGRMLSDMGADVVKVEPPGGDMTRLWGEVRHGLSGFFTQQNAGKRNVCIDLKVAGGAALVVDLAARADVLIENFRPGVLARLGLTWEALREANPALVMLSVTGFGQAGPGRDRPAFAPVIHAESGLIARQATFDGNWPTDPMLSIADTNAALHGLAAILAALYLRQRTGEGQHIDLAMLDTMLVTDDYAHHEVDGHPVTRLGGHVFEAHGGPLLLAGEMRFIWRQLAATHGIDDGLPADAPLDAKIPARHQAVATWVRSFTDRDDLHEAADAAGIAWGDVRAWGDVASAPSVVTRGMITHIDDRGGGRRGVVQSPYRFSNASAGIRGPVAYRGEHNADVLREWLDLDEAAIATLAGAGVIAAEELPRRD